MLKAFPLTTPLLIILFLLLAPFDSYAQHSQDPRTVALEKKWRPGINPHAGIYSPFSYGGGLSILLGKKGDHVFIRDNSHALSSFKGFSVDGALYRGAIGLGVSYFDYTSYFIPGGLKLGLSYYRTNSYSWFAESAHLYGLELEANLYFQVKGGLLMNADNKKLIPSFGFGFSLVPGL